VACFQQRIGSGDSQRIARAVDIHCANAGSRSLIRVVHQAATSRTAAILALEADPVPARPLPDGCISRSYKPMSSGNATMLSWRRPGDQGAITFSSCHGSNCGPVEEVAIRLYFRNLPPARVVCEGGGEAWICFRKISFASAQKGVPDTHYY
jgi:hypothetical protein